MTFSKYSGPGVASRALALGLAGLCAGPLALAQGQAGAADAGDTQQRSIEEIRSCSRANLPEKSMVQALEITITERSGDSRTIEASFFLKRFEREETRGTLQVRQPVDVSGVSYLWVDTAGKDRLYLYLPTLQRVRRVSGKSASDSLLGSDFSYEDIKYLRGLSAGGESERLTDAQLDGRAVHRLALTPPKGDESAYSRLLFHVDRETCVPLQIDFFAADDAPVKRMVADPDSLENLNSRWLARRVTMHNLQDKTQTRMLITGVEFDEHVNDAVFNQRGFYLGAYIPETDIPNPELE